MTNEQIQEYITKDKDKWASLNELAPAELVEEMYDAASYFCYDAVNIVLEHHSTTSGMYSSWHIKISDSCTIYIKRIERPPIGIGGTVTAAVADFILNMRKIKEERIAKKLEEQCSSESQSSLG